MHVGYMRLGHCTNSSSAHSIVVIDDNVPQRPPDEPAWRMPSVGTPRT